MVLPILHIVAALAGLNWLAGCLPTSFPCAPRLAHSLTCSRRESHRFQASWLALAPNFWDTVAACLAARMVYGAQRTALRGWRSGAPAVSSCAASLSLQLQFNICVRTNTKPDFVISFSPRSRRVARFVSYYVLLPCTQGYCQAVVRMYRVIDFLHQHCVVKDWRVWTSLAKPNPVFWVWK